MAPGDEARLEKILRQARRKLGLAEGCQVVSCYEAGRDGFWVHRWLTSLGISNVIVDSSSIKVDRRSKRAKTDRLDAKALVQQLERWWRGDEDRPRDVRVPGVHEEDLRQVDRELLTLSKERTAHVCRMRSLVATHGVRASTSVVRCDATELCGWDGSPLPQHLHDRLQRERGRLELVEQQMDQLKRHRDQLIRTGSGPAMAMVRQLTLLRGVAETSAWLFVMELFGWREIRNRRQLGSLAGLTSMPYSSGPNHREQGISKAGSRRVRTMAVQIAWSWLRWQPDSALSRWYRERFGGGSERERKRGIVALARKLLIRLWQFLERGEVPAGAVLKPIAST
jgi:transposase